MQLTPEQAIRWIAQQQEKARAHQIIEQVDLILAVREQGLDINRLAFYRWLYKTGRLNDDTPNC